MTERRLVVTMAIGEVSRKYLEVTGPLIQAYALKCNADFHVVYNEAPGYPSLGYQKWEYIRLLEVYDRILHIDADMIVRNTTPNLFDIVPDRCFGAVDELPYQNLDIELPPVDRISDVHKFDRSTPLFYINVGLYLFDTSHINLFTEMRPDNPCYFKEQTHLNANLRYIKDRMCLLPSEFNFMKLMENSGLDKSKAHIVHYAGGWGGLSVDKVLELMKEDYK